MMICRFLRYNTVRKFTTSVSNTWDYCSSRPKGDGQRCSGPGRFRTRTPTSLRPALTALLRVSTVSRRGAADGQRSRTMMRFPSSSRAAVVREFKAPVCIEEVPIPKELEPGTILTRIETCSICGTDVHLWQGSLALKVDLPVIIGHEMVGRVVALGPGADRDSIGQDLRVGDRITWTHTSCGSCYFC